MPVYDMGYKAVEIVDGKDIAERLVLGVELVQRQSVLFK
jgi:hypothetical protein